jgi:hypothetical protein
MARCGLSNAWRKKMKLYLLVDTEPDSFDAQDAIANSLQDDGLRSDLEVIIGHTIERFMRWRDIHVRVRVKFPYEVTKK